MKTVIIHGQSHEGSTCHIARTLAEKIGGETTEFFLPADFGEFCTGCIRCFLKGETECPHRGRLAPIVDAMDAADVVILASPVYVYHVTGAMKAFLDHFGYRFMVHRPEESMFRKQGVCICTAAGGGMKSTLKDMAHSLFFWGTARIYKYGVGVAAVKWEGVGKKKKAAIDKATSKLAGKIVRRHGQVKPGLKTRLFFNLMRLVQKKARICQRDVEYWTEKGWLGSSRPWD